MAKEAVDHSGRRIPWRVIGWSTAGLLFVLPWLTKAPWNGSDYILAGAFIGGIGLAFELIVAKSGSLCYRLGAALAVGAACLTILINGAVGMIGSEDNPYNLLFVGVPLIALAGSILTRFDSAGMARAMAVGACAQVAVGAFGIATDLRGAIMSIVFAGLWLLAAALFRNASSDQPDLRAHQR